MHAIIEDNREAIESACRKYGVLRLEVFGSAARGDDFDPEKSDVDFIAEFQRPIPMGAFKQFFGFQVELEDRLGRGVDVVELHCVDNPYLLETMNRDRKTIYDHRRKEVSS